MPKSYYGWSPCDSVVRTTPFFRRTHHNLPVFAFTPKSWQPHPSPDACSHPFPSVSKLSWGFIPLTWYSPGSCTITPAQTPAWVLYKSPAPIWAFFPRCGHCLHIILFPTPLLPIPSRGGPPEKHRPPATSPAIPHQPLCWRWWGTPGNPGSTPAPYQKGGRIISQPMVPPLALTSTYQQLKNHWISFIQYIIC